MNKPILFVAVLLINIFFISLAVAHSQKVQIVEGEFAMGCSAQDDKCLNNEAAEGGIKVFVPTFLIDSHEVTVIQYQRCIDAGECERPKDFKRNKYCNLGAEDRLSHPINCVDWQQAVDYCEYVDGRLPLESEWEKAARAGSTSRYPWGQEVTCKNAIVDDGVTFGSVPNEPDGCGEDRTWPVASRAPNAFGLYDMHGNAGEWTANWFGRQAITEYYKMAILTGPPRGKQRVVRGGSWDEKGKNLRSSYRNVKPPVSGRSVYGSIGFRCAYDAE